MKRIPLISAIIEGLVRLVKSLNCRCHSKCCESDCTQRPVTEVKIEDFAEKIGEVKHVVEL